MKPAFVSFVLALAACELPTDPPAATIPRPPDNDRPVVIVGRVVYSSQSVGLEAANVRVIEARASVGSGETGHYRIVLPPTFRGQTMPVKVRAIGFKPQSRTVALTSDTVNVDFAMTVDTTRIVCEVVMSGAVFDRGSR